MTTSRFKELIRKYHAATITSQEWKELTHFVSDDVNKEKVTAEMRETFDQMLSHPLWNARQKQEVWEKIRPDQQIVEEEDVAPAYYARRNNIFANVWLRIAAAVLVIGLFGALYFSIIRRDATRLGVAQDSPAGASDVDISPGGNKAVLTLADGSIIVLDSSANGIIAQQGSARIEKLSNGKIVYRSGGTANNHILHNTMSTPRGGQYQLTLPDNTRIWMNAESSITYPVVFSGTERRVEITGEIYFEVQRNQNMPFIVDVDGRSEVEVLGTEFNVNSYLDEKAILTTLIEGSVKVSSLSTQLAILEPGQQAQISFDNSSSQKSLRPNVRIVDNTDLNKVTAWKNGFFSFEGADLHNIMRQLSRWYDIEVVFEGKVPDGKFRGKMDRGLTLNQVLNILSESEVRYKLENRKLIIKE